jgi:hypothetical protein
MRIILLIAISLVLFRERQNYEAEMMNCLSFFLPVSDILVDVESIPRKAEQSTESRVKVKD